MIHSLHIPAIVVLGMLLLSGCFVQGEDHAYLAIAVEKDDDSSVAPKLASKAASVWAEAAQPLGLFVQVSARDLFPSVSAVATATTGEETRLSLELEVPPGSARALDAVLFQSISPPFESYAPDEPVLLDLQSGEQRRVTLTLQKMESVDVPMRVTNAGGNVQIGMLDLESGIDLPGYDCAADDGLCTWPNAPLGRKLVPVVTVDEARTERPDLTFMVQPDMAEIEITLE